MTGRYPQANGLMGLVHNPWLWEMHPAEKHLAAILHDGGYQSVLFNTQHESSDWQRLGFDRFVDCKGGAAHRPTAADTAAAFGSFLKEKS